eukprot:9450067-Ditylum_brightwellii.AAC.1
MTLEKPESNLTTRTGTHCKCETTTGSKLLALWKDGSKAWAPLKNMKESHPFGTAEIDVVQELADKSAFSL